MMALTDLLARMGLTAAKALAATRGVLVVREPRVCLDLADLPALVAVTVWMELLEPLDRTAATEPMLPRARLAPWALLAVLASRAGLASKAWLEAMVLTATLVLKARVVPRVMLDLKARLV